MANTGFKGIDIRQTGSELVFRALLQNSSGALVTTGTVNFYLMELQSDGTIKTYDFSTNTFASTTVTTEALAGTYRKSNNGATDTGLWTAALATLTGFTNGAIYFLRCNCSTAFPTDIIREFQYGSAEGDVTLTASATGVGFLQTDLKTILGTASPAAAGSVSVDWNHIVNATATVNLSATAINSVTSGVNAVQWGGVGVGGMPLATGSYTAPPSAASIAQAVWIDATDTGVTNSFGAMVLYIWTGMQTFAGADEIGVVTTVTSASDFVVNFANAVTDADLVGRTWQFKSGNNRIAAQAIQAATNADSTHVRLQFAVGFQVAPSTTSGGDSGIVF